MNKSAVLPEVYSGENSWEEWIDPFDSMVAVCEWDDPTKLKWLSVHLVGRAITMFRRLPETTCNNLGEEI